MARSVASLPALARPRVAYLARATEDWAAVALRSRSPAWLSALELMAQIRSLAFSYRPACTSVQFLTAPVKMLARWPWHVKAGARPPEPSGGTGAFGTGES